MRKIMMTVVFSFILQSIVFAQTADEKIQPQSTNQTPGPMTVAKLDEELVAAEEKVKHKMSDWEIAQQQMEKELWTSSGKDEEFLDENVKESAPRMKETSSEYGAAQATESSVLATETVDVLPSSLPDEVKNVKEEEQMQAPEETMDDAVISSTKQAVTPTPFPPVPEPVSDLQSDSQELEINNTSTENLDAAAQTEGVSSLPAEITPPEGPMNPARDEVLTGEHEVSDSPASEKKQSANAGNWKPEKTEEKISDLKRDDEDVLTRWQMDDKRVVI